MKLAELFVSSRGQPVTLDGRLVHSIYRRSVQPDDQFRLTVVESRTRPIQGIRMKVTAGRIQIDEGSPLADVVLWTTTAPRSVLFRFVGNEPAELRIWNCWLDESDVMQAWIGNAGIVIEERNGVVQLRCNSRTEVTFEDLVLKLEPPSPSDSASGGA